MSVCVRVIYMHLDKTCPQAKAIHIFPEKQCSSTSSKDC